jgi:UMF1 family MFS transporter
MPAGKNFVTVALHEIGTTFREILRLKHTALFLVAYLFYNDGVQTVIYQSSVFIDQELFISRGLPSNPIFLVLLFFEVQVIAMIGSFFWAWLANRVGAKTTILITLGWWACVVIFAYAFLQETWQAWFLGAGIGFVLGGTQAMSRSLYSQMIPKGREASFFSFYEISERGTSWMGPLIFFFVVGATNSFRQAILALVVFFIIGGLILYFADTKKAVAAANPSIQQ